MKNKLISSIALAMVISFSAIASMSVNSAEKTGKLLARKLNQDQKAELVKFLISLKELYDFLSQVSTQHTWERMNQSQMKEFQEKVNLLINKVSICSLQIMDELNSCNPRPLELESLVLEILKNLNPLSAITRLGARSDSKDMNQVTSTLIAQLQ